MRKRIVKNHPGKGTVKRSVIRKAVKKVTQQRKKSELLDILNRCVYYMNHSSPDYWNYYSPILCSERMELLDEIKQLIKRVKVGKVIF